MAAELFYDRHEDLRKTLQMHKKRMGANYELKQLFKAAVWYRDTPFVIYLIEREKINTHDFYIKRLNWLGIKSKPLPLLEWAEKEHYEELVDYLKMKKREGEGRMYEYVVQQDDDGDQ